MPKSNWSKLKSSRIPRKHPKPADIRKDLGRWKPLDDFLLIEGVLQTNDLEIVHLGTKFSCRFTFEEIKNRWDLLMYNERISGLAIDSMRNLHPELIEKAERNILFSPQEEQLLTIITDEYPDITKFEELLEQNTDIFHHSRKPKDLMEYHELMKHYNLLPGQPLKITVPSFYEIENAMDDYEIYDSLEDPALVRELGHINRIKLMEIRRLENEMKTWSILVGSIRTNQPHPMMTPEMDDQRFAMIRGRKFKFFMKSTKITLGRNTKDNIVDIDLSLEGSEDKISRKQGTLQLRNDGNFFLSNDGKRTIFIDGYPILRNNKMKLRNNSLIEIANLSFVFLVNHDLVNAIRQQEMDN